MCYSQRKVCQMRKYLILFLIISIIGLCGFSMCAKAETFGETKRAVISVPEGQTIHAIVTTPLTSNRLSLGQNVTMALGEDFYYNNKVIIPVDSIVYGSVIRVSGASAGNIGELMLRFTRITTPYGIQIPISAIVKNDTKVGKITGLNTEFHTEAGDVDIPVTTPIDLVLTQPITVNPEIYNTNY